MHYFKRNIGDYHKKAGRLSMVEHGAYTLLIDACYDRERFPTKEEAIDWCWARTAEEINAVTFVLGKFFDLVEGRYVQQRIQEEIEAYRATALKNKEIAERREEARRTKREQEDTKRERGVNEAPPNHKPLTINQEPEDQEQCAANATPGQAEPKPDGRKRGTRLPDDWALSPELAAWAKAERPELDDRMVQAMADSFRDFWISKTGKDATKLNWDATWRNWVRNQRIGGNQRASPAQSQSHHTELDKIDHTEGLVRQPDGTYRVARS